MEKSTKWQSDLNKDYLLKMKFKAFFGKFEQYSAKFHFESLEQLKKV